MNIIRSSERFITETDWLKSFHVFNFNRFYKDGRDGFGQTLVINDDYIAPHAGFPMHSHSNMEILTYVMSGRLTHEDTMGNKAYINAGEAQLMSVGSRISHAEFNNESTPIRLLQIWILPDEMYSTSKYESIRDVQSKGIVASSHGPLHIRSSTQVEFCVLENTDIEYVSSEDEDLLLYIINGSMSTVDIVFEEGDTLLFEKNERQKFSIRGRAEYMIIRSFAHTK